MQYIRAMSMQKKFMERNRISIDNILDSWVLSDEMSTEKTKKINSEGETTKDKPVKTQGINRKVYIYEPIDHKQ